MYVCMCVGMYVRIYTYVCMYVCMYFLRCGTKFVFELLLF